MSHLTAEERMKGTIKSILTRTKPKTKWKDHIQKEHDIHGTEN